MQLANTIKCKSWKTTDPGSGTWEEAFQNKPKYSALEKEKTFLHMFKNTRNVKNDRVGVFRAVHCGKKKKCAISFIYPYIIGLLIIMYVKSLRVAPIMQKKVYCELMQCF